MTFIAVCVATLRVVAASFALYNIGWSASGARHLMRGRFQPPEIYMSVVFWFSTAVIVFQLVYLTGRQPGWQLLSYTILATSMGLATVGHRLGGAMKARQFYATYDHLGVATAMVDLAKVDAAAAEQLAAEARRLTAKAVLANV